MHRLVPVGLTVPPDVVPGCRGRGARFPNLPRFLGFVLEETFAMARGWHDEGYTRPTACFRGGGLCSSTSALNHPWFVETCTWQRSDGVVVCGRLACSANEQEAFSQSDRKAHRGMRRGSKVERRLRSNISWSNDLLLDPKHTYLISCPSKERLLLHTKQMPLKAPCRVDPSAATPTPLVQAHSPTDATPARHASGQRGCRKRRWRVQVRRCAVKRNGRVGCARRGRFGMFGATARNRGHTSSLGCAARSTPRLRARAGPRWIKTPRLTKLGPCGQSGMAWFAVHELQRNLRCESAVRFGGMIAVVVVVGGGVH
nr:hypothetical protein CFP56_11175 [Quercus suber]